MRTILDASRADAKALELSPEEERIEDVVTTAVLDARDLERARIVAEVTSDLPPVKVDPQRLAQAVTLVVLAAARLGGKGVSLRAARRADVGILIDVEAPEISSRPTSAPLSSRRSKNAESARVLGSLGLGLTFARTLLRAHGGELEIEAAEGAEGTLFRMRLPAPAAA